MLDMCPASGAWAAEVERDGIDERALRKLAAITPTTDIFDAAKIEQDYINKTTS